MWFTISVLCFIAAYYSWRLGDEWAARKAAAAAAATNQPPPTATASKPAALAHPEVTNLLAQVASQLPWAPTNMSAKARIAYRLNNTTESLGQLIRNPKAILLENALLDTTQGTDLPIPGYLRASGDPGAYLVQARGPVDEPFRALLRQAGASIVSYIPNNAYLVRASQAAARQLAQAPQTQAVLPYEPYYKLKPWLLRASMEQLPLPPESRLRLLLFADARQQTVAELQQLGLEVLSEEPTPFGPMVEVQPSFPAQPFAGQTLVPALARLPGVQEIELGRKRMAANDLGRATTGVSFDSVVQTNYLDLTGSNVMVAMTDSGVDRTHPDLVNRVFGDFTNSLVDTDGHGTHVAGIIAGDGNKSMTVTNAQGSIMPPTNGQFRGRAPGAKLFSMTGGSDYYEQVTAAQTNALISNNSWTYGNNDYDIYAASYDAAVRDSLPDVPGSHPVVYVFATGNGGTINNWDNGNNDNGLGGNADTIHSPATAKNVITVGYIEQYRSISNEVWGCTPAQGTNSGTNGTTCWTNQQWLPSTDSGDLNHGFQVAKYSGRGNVGVFVEGDFGRFKPDVVAPGTFVVSTRSAQWDEKAYYNPTGYLSSVIHDAVLDPTNLWPNVVFVPNNAVKLEVWVLPNQNSPTPFPDMPILVRQADFPTTNTFDFAVTNYLSIPPDGPSSALAPVNTDWHYAVMNTTTQSIIFDVMTVITVTNEHGNFFQVLSNMNNELGSGPPYYYRYESGSSMAAAGVSGTLALMEEFFQKRLARTNSPALMKAMLINGARSLSLPYDFGVTNDLNFQGWGLVNLPTTIPGALLGTTPATNGPSGVPMLYFDQDPTNALATGSSCTRLIKVLPDAIDYGLSLRVTLVWTDPPGNPVAGVKLVNDLDLIVTNLDTGEVFFGNDILSGNTANLPWDTNSVPNVDVVNNVENVYLGPTLGTNYSITVVGRRVNANAVTAHTNSVVQDYALVVSCGDGDITNAISLTSTGPVISTNLPLLTLVGNMFTNSTDFSGGVLLHQHVGANTPLLGTNQFGYPVDANAVITRGITNQWHFYAVTNIYGYTNAAFMTFTPLTLTMPRMGLTNTFNTDNATRPEADIDMYVSTESALTNLGPVVLSNAFKSVGPGGTETIILSNAVDVKGSIYYIAVKSEDQLASEYGFLAVFSLNPFSDNVNGDQRLHGFPVPSLIPDGSPDRPGSTTVFAIAPMPIKLHRVIVTNRVSHENVGDLLGMLSHSGDFAVLHNHSTNFSVLGLLDWYNVYDDSDLHDINGSRHTDGPGTLQNFAGKSGSGQWILTEIDNALTHTGMVTGLTIYLERQRDLTEGIYVTLHPGACDNEYVDVPLGATNLTVTATVVSNVGPIDITMQLCPLGSTAGCKNTAITNQLPTSLTIDEYDNPPLMPGTYYVRLCNHGTGDVTIFVKATIYMNYGAISVSVADKAGPVTLQDDSITYATINVTNHMLISDLDVGLLINHPRISDLAITLISPDGTRVLLFQDRGGDSTNGLGTFSANLNPYGGSTFAYTNSMALWTNNFDAAPVGVYGPGSVFEGWTVISNQVTVYPDYSLPWLQNNILVLGDGVVSNSLPTTNSTQYHLSFRVTHAPYIVGMTGWWPFDGNARDIFGGYDGLLSGNVLFSTGKVSQAFYDHSSAFYGDGIATKMMVPACPELNLLYKGRSPVAHSFSVEGWINPANVTNPAPLVEWFDPMNPSPEGVQFWVGDISGTNKNAGVLSAAIWDTNSQPHFVATPAFVLTNGGWQHVALTFNAFNFSATLYTNGGVAVQQSIPSDIVPRIAGNLYFGFDPPPVPTLAFTDFLNATNLNLVDSALVNSNVLRITPATPSVAGAAWYKQKIPCAGGFSTAFRCQLTGQDSVNGPPSGPVGFCFSIQNLGANAPSSQYGPSTNSINVCFITRTAILPAPGDNSVGVRIGGETNWLATRSLNDFSVNFSDGQVHLVQIECDGQKLAVMVDNHLAISGLAIPLSGALDATGQGWVGFGGRTDLFWENHDILAWTFNANLPNPGLAYMGGLDEFSVYSRALSSQEVRAIFNTSTNGKYGTNALICPVTMQVALNTTAGNLTYTFTNGLTWTNNGPFWETNSIDFTNDLKFAYTNGPATNFTPIVLTPLDPNVAVDDFVLSSVVTNYLDGLMHFNNNTNIALVPIKFAPWPYVLSNSPPTDVFSNSFLLSTSMVFATGTVIAGSSNNTAVGIRDWTVVQGPVTVVSNALVEPEHTNFLALATGAVQCVLPTSPGRRYLVTYNLRGPCAVGWWNGSVNPLDNRALDLIGGNDGALINGASFTGNSWVGNSGFFFNGMLTNGVAGNPYLGSKIELGDPQNLRLTNSFTIEGWIKALDQTNDYVNTLAPETFIEQIFFRGDSRDCMDPYYLGLERVSPPGETPERYDIVFHIEDAIRGNCGVILETGDQPITSGNWYHLAAVFECNYNWKDNAPYPTNMLRLYVNGKPYTNVFLEDPSDQFIVYTSFTSRFPFRDLDPSYSPGVTIGNSSRLDASQPFRGFIDELSAYGRALTDPEIKAIYDAGQAGKADLSVPPSQSLAKAAVFVDDVQMGVAYGENSRWTAGSFLFSAYHTNTLLTLQGLLPGTLLDSVTLTEMPAELNYQPEDALEKFFGKDAYGNWRLEIVDTRGGPVDTNLTQLVEWLLNFKLLPTNPPPVIELVHGITYTNMLVGYGAQNFIVNVPLWATNATNVLLSAFDRAGVSRAMGVLYDTNSFPTATANVLFWPPVFAPQTNVLTTNTAATTSPVLGLGRPYYLTVTNPNPLAVQFAVGVWFDLISLTNCEMLTNCTVAAAGIPRYFQFDVPTNAALELPRDVAFWLGHANSNLTVVLSQHLPLPDLTHYDYISDNSSTNDEITMVVTTNVPGFLPNTIATNSTPWPIETNRWYIGVFNTAETNVAFDVQACYSTNFPTIITLTNGLEYTASFTQNTNSLAPPGPPRWLFYRFQITNYVDGVLFELYGLSGDADLVLQRDVPPTMEPYFAHSWELGLAPEEIVVRAGAALPDLRGNWYLGVYNNELTNKVAYTIRAVLPVGGILQSALPIVATNHLSGTNNLLLSWHAIIGEWYAIRLGGTFVSYIQATTPLATCLLPVPVNGDGYTVVQVQPPVRPMLHIVRVGSNQVRISWPPNFAGFTLQYSLSLTQPVWTNVNLPVVLEGNEFVVYDVIGPVAKYYRLIQ